MRQKKAARLSRRATKLASKAKQAGTAGKTKKAARLNRRATKLKSKSKPASRRRGMY